MSNTQLTLRIHESDNLPWVNNLIAAIFYSKYSRELILNNDIILEKLKKIFKFSSNTKENLEEIIRIIDTRIYDISVIVEPDNLNYLNKTNETEKIKELNINYSLYKYLLTNNKQLTAFILPKFLELIGSSCISVERYNSKNYIGLYDIFEYNKGNISRFFNNSAFILKDIKQKDIKKIYHEPKDYILINKWNNENIPDIFKKVSDKDQDEDGIDNKYRLSSTYKKDGDLDITDIIKEQITYNGYYYKLDSCIISDNNTKKNSSRLLTFLTHEDKKYVYLGNVLSTGCTELHELKSYEEVVSIYSKFPCVIFKSNTTFINPDETDINPDEIDNISTYDMKNGSNYTLIYVKFKKIEDEKKEKEAVNKIAKVYKNKIIRAKELKEINELKIQDRIKKIKELKDLEKKLKELEKEKEEKYKKLEEEKQEKVEQLEKEKDKFKQLEKEKEKKLKELEKEKDKLEGEKKADIEKDIKTIEDIKKKISEELPVAKKEDFKNLITLLDEYIQILTNSESDNIKQYEDIEKSIDKIKNIQEEIKDNELKQKEYKRNPDGKKTKYEKNFISNYTHIKIYLDKFIIFIINLLSRQNIIGLIKDEIKDLPDNKKINQILEAISKLPNVDQFQQLNDLLKPTEKKTKEILEAIKTLPNDAKLTTIETLLSPTGAKLDKILDTITELSKQDYKKIIQDAIAQLPKEDNKKLIDDLNAKIDAMQQILLSKIQEQKAVARSKDITLQPEIDDLKRQLQLMGDIQKQLADVSKQDYKKIVDDAISKMPKQDNKKLIDDLNAKMDAMQQTLLSKIQEQRAVARSKDITLQPEIDDLKRQLQLMGDIQKQLADVSKQDYKKIVDDAISKMPKQDNKKLIDDLNAKMDAMQQTLLSKIQEQRAVARSKDITLQPEIDDLKRQLQLMGDIQKQLSEASKTDHTKIVQDLNLKLDNMQKELLEEIKEIKKNSLNSSKSNITLQSEISSLNQQLQLLGEIQKKLSETGYRDNKQLLADMQQELVNFSHKDNEKIILGVQDLLRSFNEQIILKQNEKDIKIHKEHLLLLKEIKSQLDKDVKSRSSSKSKKDDRETELLKLENVELKKQIEILKDIQMKCKRQQKDYERCNKHNMLPYQYIKFKEDELLGAIEEHFKSSKKPSDKIIIEFIFQYFEKNNKVMNLYIIEKYMGDIYDVMKIFNKKYNIENVNITQFYRLLASISIYAKFNDKIKKIFIK